MTILVAAMRRAAFALLAAWLIPGLVPGMALATPALVQSADSQGNGAYTNSGSATFLAAVASGDMVCVSLQANGSVTTVSITDDKGNNYGSAVVTAAGTGGYYVYAFYLQNITNGPKTISWATTGQAGITLTADEFSGASGALDGSNAAFTPPRRRERPSVRGRGRRPRRASPIAGRW